MYDSYHIGNPEMERMHPKDERLTLLAYNVGKNQHLEDEVRELKQRLGEATNRAEKAEANSRWIQERLDRLQATYDKCSNYALKIEKQLSKLKGTK